MPSKRHLAVGAAYSIVIYLALAGAAVLWIADIGPLLFLGRWLFVVLPLPAIAALVYHLRRIDDGDGGELLYP